jgi:tetratricopeptide (TPR) repeat protein
VGGLGVREGQERASDDGRLFQGDRVPHTAPGNCQGSGQLGWGDEGRTVREHWDRVSVVGGRISKAIEYHTECLASAKQLDDRAGEWQAYGNIGNSYFSMGNFSRAIEYHMQCLGTTKEVGDRAGEAGAYGKFGICHLSL